MCIEQSKLVGFNNSKNYRENYEAGMEDRVQDCGGIIGVEDSTEVCSEKERRDDNNTTCNPHPGVGIHGRLQVGEKHSRILLTMADYSNYKILNPKLLSFEILADSTRKRARGAVWSYSVRYSELFEHIPVGTNTAVANYTVYQDKELQVRSLRI